MVQDSQVKRPTGSLVIDYGARGKRIETYRIATNVRRDHDTNKPLGIPMRTLLGPKILDLQFETQPSSTTGYQVPTGLELSSNSGESARIGATESEGFWVVISDSGVDQDAVDFGDLVLNQNEQLSLVFVQDRDADGLDDFEERELGTDPQDPNTDNDAYDEAVDAKPLVPETYTIVDGYNWANRHVTFGNVRVNGGTARVVTLTPGASYTLSFDWRLAVDNADIYCPGCIVQLYYGVQDNGSTCYVSRTMPPRATGSGSTSSTFTAPSEPGTYFVNHALSVQYSCVGKNVGRDPNNAIAVINVR